MTSSSNNDLVSIVVITYNSSKYIIETLQSIENQSYENIELIISDDCSVDDTIKLCKEWRRKCERNFISFKIIESNVNSGITCNCLRGENACNGRWIKIIGGDDILFPEAITNYMNYVQLHPEIHFLFGKVKPIGCSSSICNEWENDCQNDKYFYNFFAQDSKEQHKRIITHQSSIPAPSCFYDLLFAKKNHIRFDTSIPYVDDCPRWVQATKKHEKLYLLPIVTIGYRLHKEQITAKKSFAYEKSVWLLWRKYMFWYNFLQHPRQTLIKFIYLGEKFNKNILWIIFKYIIKTLDYPYRLIKRRSYNDWEGIYTP